MTPDRTAILNRVASGELSATAAADLLKNGEAPVPALGAPKAPAFNASPASLAGRWLHIRVSDLASGRSKVNVNVPLMLVQWGVNMGHRHAPELADMDWDGLFAQIQGGARGTLIDVEDLESGEHVEISVD